MDDMDIDVRVCGDDVYGDDDRVFPWCFILISEIFFHLIAQ